MDTPMIDLDNRFMYHQPQAHLKQTERYQALRDKGKELAQLIIDSTPDSREQSLAITRVEEAIFWANAAIARRE